MGETSFSLVFSIEVLILMEIGLPFHQVDSFDEQKNLEDLRANHDHFEEIKERARIRMATYQQ